MRIMHLIAILGLMTFLFGCAEKLVVLKSVDQLTSFKQITIDGKKREGSATGITLKRGDKVLVFSTGEVNIGSNTSVLPKGLLKFQIEGSSILSEWETLDVDKKYASLYFTAHQSGVVLAGIHELEYYTESLAKDTQQLIYKGNADNSGQFNLKIFILPEEKEFQWGQILDDIAFENPNEKQLVEQIEAFPSTQAYVDIKNKEIWFGYQERNNLKGYLEFTRTHPNHPKLLDALETVQNKILNAYKDYFWDLKRYKPIDKDSSRYGGFWANTNNEEKIELFEKLADAGYSMANFVLSDIYYLGVKDYDPQKAYELAKKAADDENSFGILQQAKFQYLGIGTTKNKILAKKAFKKHIPLLQSMVSHDNEQLYTKLEIAIAQYFLGWAKNNGVGIIKHRQEALFHYVISGDSGYIAAKYNLALQFLTGKSVSQDIKRAENTIGKFASLGFKKAQSNLKWMYESGKHSGEFLNYLTYWYKPPENLFWQYAQKSDDAKILIQFIKHYPTSHHTDIIIKKINYLKNQLSEVSQDLQEKTQQDAIFIDKNNNLIWQNSNFIYGKKGADTYLIEPACGYSQHAGYKDWMMPTKDQLFSLKQNLNKINSSITKKDPLIFKEALHRASRYQEYFQLSTGSIINQPNSPNFLVCVHNLY